jgi:hypothetical protein
VNGGGQLKPVLPGTGIDEEGYKRDWEGSGVAVGGEGVEANVLQNTKWGDKEWTKRVEEVYWRDKDGVLGEPGYLDADALMVRVWDDLVRGTEDERMEVDGETEVLDQARRWEERRRRFFRTQYRAVESEVVGLAVVW